MKNSIIIILTLFCLAVSAQKPNTRRHFKIGDISKTTDLAITIYTPDSIEFTGSDSLAVMKMLVNSYFQMQNQLYAAFNVISLINVNGVVTDFERFDKAMATYRKTINH